MLITIDKDEWWPVFEPRKAEKPDVNTIEIPEAFYERYRKVLIEFQEVQDILQDYEDKLP